MTPFFVLDKMLLLCYNKEKGGEVMGMTDRQFDDRQKGLLRELKRIETEIEQVKNGELNNSPTLEQLKKDTEEYLQRP